MSLCEKLEIVLITYNRKFFLEKTFEEIFASNSPVRDLQITVLNNNSDDGTTELVDSYAAKYSNLKHIVHPKNIGGNANITRALEIAQKDYVWVIADNDGYNWTAWQEVEQAIEEGYDAIVTANVKNTTAEIFYSSALISGCIYKTANITETVLSNAYDNIRFLFPHLAVCAKNINDNNKFYIVSKDIVKIGVNPNMSTTYNRGMLADEVPLPRRNIFWSVGYFTSVELISSRKTQIEIINGLRHYHKSLFDLFKTIVILNKIQKNNYFYNYQQIYRVLNLSQRLKFIMAFLLITFSTKNYEFWFIRYKEEWIEYLGLIKEQDYINKLVKKMRGKRILLYGAGLTAQVLLENYDFSNLNIVGISDKKFENSSEEDFYGYRAFAPNEIKDLDVDIILFTMKEYKKIANILKTNGVTKKMLPAINKSRYVIKN